MKITPKERQIIIKVCDKVRKDLIDKHRTVMGLCEEASTIIAQELKKQGIRVRKDGGAFCLDEESLDHSWITYRGVIIDATLSQFNDYGLTFPDIFFGDEDEYIAACYKSWKNYLTPPTE